ncbi:MAG: hypothetical protein JXR50_06240 [Prolixibacteraceae bacterium]|nr:hypothetical protein [Prolixibacteraceae bacterium]MBN2649322.1 hypothetical protein [Prolixibacteraceae bacterium]
MKTLKITIVILLACFLTGCNNDNETLEKSALIEVKARPISLQTGQENILKTTTEHEVVFTTSEIESYNKETGEIIFTSTGNDETFADILSRYDENLSFYMNDSLLFSLKSKIVTDVESALYNEPLLHYSIVEDAKYYIRDGYPWGLPVDDTTTVRTGQSASVEEIRRTNSSKIEKGWKAFINVLKEENKIAAP